MRGGMKGIQLAEESKERAKVTSRKFLILET